MTETNRFVAYIPAQPAKLVLGSFPCRGAEGYGNFFYSGSGRNYFWPVLSAISEMPAATRQEKMAICDRYGIALADVALKVRRKLANCSDSNLVILEYNTKAIQKCLDAGVRKVFFTSRFVQTHFYRVFPGSTLPAQLLPSPSPAANRHIGGLPEYRALLNSEVVRDVLEYRIRSYRELLFS